MTDTNTAMAALFQLLCGAAKWKTVTRKRQALSDLKAERQPLMFLTTEFETYPGHLSGMPVPAGIEAECWVFCRADNNLWPETQPSPIEAYVDAVKRAIAPSNLIPAGLGSLPAPFSGQVNTNTQTLGGLVQDVRIAGHGGAEAKIEKWPGESGQAAACIPLHIILP